VAPYTANKWYHVRLDVNFEDKCFDAYLDGVRVVRAQAWPVHQYYDSYGIRKIFTLISPPAQANANTTYIDDMRVSVYYSHPTTYYVEYPQEPTGGHHNCRRDSEDKGW
jgi:hypothetical protein